MGGHGALTIYLRESSFRSASAFAPICHPTLAPWGKKAFEGYFADAKKGEEHDATLLLSKLKLDKKEREVNILIDCGTADQFYEQKQLLPEAFERTAREAGYEEKQVQVRLQEGYDHSYYFISTFAPEHVHWHAKFLKA
ncbi:alpha/beta-hydrolase [Tilletiopsis washingtonensis]|uniref:S-formylglutathione hydrolase n=1 Tax=Tilletiopsis washingtonensis TaxID=58919 RepID=A0A316ZGH0_9BASI|nr:alpha/beta-hydrolase [Tilletiopsis washingtonensis]PWO00861.1 alpha/beta-hydrolase [Tilletiopsis washingtonensis]